MVAIAPFVGLVVAPVAAVVVYGDAARRDLPDSSRLRWSLGVGAVGFAGFLVPLFFGDGLVRVYLQAVRSRPVVSSPRELLLIHLAVGVAFAAGSVALYAIGSRRMAGRDG